MADFAYSSPSQLLLQGCEGQSLLSSNGVRQGDALSAVLFCLYLRNTLAEITELANVQIHSYFDDVSVSGEPAAVVKALLALQDKLPGIGLKLNTAKSRFAYFHETEAPLQRSVVTTLAGLDITVHYEHLEVVGAVVGRDEDAIRKGVAAKLDDDEGTAAFFHRLQLDELTVQSALLILRQCAVPKMHYALRCTPPSCIELAAATFDGLVINAAQTKLRLHSDEVGRDTTQQLLRAPLRHGGFGLTSALQTSLAAYLGSLAAVASAPEFAAYNNPAHMLPANAPLYGWIATSMATLIDTAPPCAALLPPSAAVFFQHPTILHSSSLQRTLSQQATEYTHQASLQRAREAKKTDGAVALAHLTAVSAPRAWTWKTVLPTTRELELTDVQYRLAARLNLGLQPVDSVTLGALPDTCPLCAQIRASHTSIRADPWHFLSCRKLVNGEITARHDGVAEQVSRCAMLLGLRARREVDGLSTNTSLRPDLLLSLPGRTVLSDVAVCHPLAPGRRSAYGTRPLAIAKDKENVKKAKYLAMSSAHCFVQLPIALETTGGMGPAAVTLVKAMADASQEHLVMWTRADVIREVAGSLAMAVQRGNAMAVIEGYDRALHAAVAQSFANTKRRMKTEDIGPEETASSTQTTDEQEDSGQEEKENNGEEE